MLMPFDLDEGFLRVMFAVANLVFVISRLTVMLRPRGQNFGLGLGLDKLDSASNTWPRPGFGLVNLASRNVLSNAE